MFVYILILNRAAMKSKKKSLMSFMLNEMHVSLFLENRMISGRSYYRPNIRSIVEELIFEIRLHKKIT